MLKQGKEDEDKGRSNSMEECENNKKKSKDKSEQKYLEWKVKERDVKKVRRWRKQGSNKKWRLKIKILHTVVLSCAHQNEGCAMSELNDFWNEHHDDLHSKFTRMCALWRNEGK